MPTLKATDKEAYAIHCLYTVGAMILNGDDEKEIGAYLNNVAAAVNRHFSKKDREELKAKMTEFGNQIDNHSLTRLGIRRINFT